ALLRPAGGAERGAAQPQPPPGGPGADAEDEQPAGERAAAAGPQRPDGGGGDGAAAGADPAGRGPRLDRRGAPGRKPATSVPSTQYWVPGTAWRGHHGPARTRRQRRTARPRPAATRRRFPRHLQIAERLPRLQRGGPRRQERTAAHPLPARRLPPDGHRA